MPRIFDNVSEKLLKALQTSMQSATRADFCVGYFNLRGWRLLSADIDQLAGDRKGACRVLIGMNPSPGDELRQYLSLKLPRSLDQQQVLRRRRQIVAEFRRQLTLGRQTEADRAGLRDLLRQLQGGQVRVKLFLRYPLHAKLYLAHRQDPVTPTVGFLGSSNLTLAGLANQGELNTEVTDFDACKKLIGWFEERWEDPWCLDITADLIEAVSDSWAGDERSPYELYLKIAWHLAEDARLGLSQFKLPPEFADKLLEYQGVAVSVAARHLNERNGVLLGDVVGLGKTLMATAVAKILQEDKSWNSLILCPPNLTRMWQKHVDEHGLLAKVVSLGMAAKVLPEERKHHIVIIDESHNLRNHDTQRYRAVRDYIRDNESRCILLSATPYNKSFEDLSAQLRLFIGDNEVLKLRPEKYLKTIGEAQFRQSFQAHPRSIIAFEKSEHHEDWHALMHAYMVRRTRSFIERHYAETDQLTGQRYLLLSNGERFTFPRRLPKTVRLAASPQYQRLFSDKVVSLLNALDLPRYGLGQYVDAEAAQEASPSEKQQIDNLSRAGKRLMGFCRTNLFKRLESSGSSFLQSVDRHIARNMVFLHALEAGLDLPIGSLDANILDQATQDEDSDADYVDFDFDEEGAGPAPNSERDIQDDYSQRAQAAYAQFSGPYRRRFKWLRATLFGEALREALLADIERLNAVMRHCGHWQAGQDTKLEALQRLVSRRHGSEKVLVFSQFADTIRYLHAELSQRGVAQLEAVTGLHDNPTDLAQRFSPISNELRRLPADEIRVLLSTDVLSEGQNLQDCAIVVNYDLPWAIIRLSQRAGRVDRVGQKADEIRCYSFLPARGVEEIIRLRQRVRQRLQENGEVVGSDEQFFEGEKQTRQLHDLFTEKSGSLDEESDSEVDIASKAWQIWSSATKDDPQLQRRIESMPDGAYSTRHFTGSVDRRQGVITYVKTGDDADHLVWLDAEGNVVTESLEAVLDAAACRPDTPREKPHPKHFELAEAGARRTQEEDYLSSIGGQLGRARSTRRRTYEALKRHIDDQRGSEPLFVKEEQEQALHDIYRHPLLESARDKLNRQLKLKISDADLAELVAGLWQQDRLCRKLPGNEEPEPRVLCSLGLFDRAGE